MGNSEPTGNNKEENQTTTPESSINSAILEAFDGDLEDWMEWNHKVSSMEQASMDDAEYNNIESEEDGQARMDTDCAEEAVKNEDNTSAQSGNTEKLHRIDPNDPHYVNYVPDMYYEYGIGPEPKRPTPREMQDGGSGLAITSLCCSIGGVVLIFCGYGFPLAIASIVIGIITLSRKHPFDSRKVMALIAVSISSIELLGVIIYMLSLFNL